MTQPTLLVLAAGMGSRYGGLKQLDAVGPNGETIMDYSVYDAARAGFGKVVFVIRRDIEEAFRTHIGDRYAGMIDVRYAFQELDRLPAGFSVPEGREKPWGTGHAILMAEDLIAEPFAVINADDFYGAEGYRVAGDYLRQARDGERADYFMVGYRLGNTLSDHGSVSRGICHTDAEGHLTDLVETHGIERFEGGVRAPDPESPGEWVSLTGDETVSMNLWGFTPSIFTHLDTLFRDFLNAQGGEPKSEFYIPFVVNQLIQEGKATAKVLRCDATWYGVTFREDKAGVQQGIAEMVRQGVYPSPLSSSAGGDA